jgi:ribonuclease HI
VLGLGDEKYIAIDKLEVFGDCELVVNQVKDIYKKKKIEAEAIQE